MPVTPDNVIQSPFSVLFTDEKAEAFRCQISYPESGSQEVTEQGF